MDWIATYGDIMLTIVYYKDGRIEALANRPHALWSETVEHQREFARWGVRPEPLWLSAREVLENGDDIHVVAATQELSHWANGENPRRVSSEKARRLIHGFRMGNRQDLGELLTLPIYDGDTYAAQPVITEPAWI